MDWIREKPEEEVANTEGMVNPVGTDFLDAIDRFGIQEGQAKQWVKVFCFKDLSHLHL